MAENIEYVKLSGRMKSVAKDKVLAETNSIFDEKEGKFQEDINDYMGTNVMLAKSCFEAKSEFLIKKTDSAKFNTLFSFIKKIKVTGVDYAAKISVWYIRKEEGHYDVWFVDSNDIDGVKGYIAEYSVESNPQSYIKIDIRGGGYIEAELDWSALENKYRTSYTRDVYISRKYYCINETIGGKSADVLMTRDDLNEAEKNINNGISNIDKKTRLSNKKFDTDNTQFHNSDIFFSKIQRLFCRIKVSDYGITKKIALWSVIAKNGEYKLYFVDKDSTSPGYIAIFQSTTPDSYIRVKLPGGGLLEAELDWSVFSEEAYSFSRDNNISINNYYNNDTFCGHTKEEINDDINLRINISAEKINPCTSFNLLNDNDVIYGAGIFAVGNKMSIFKKSKYIRTNLIKVERGSKYLLQGLQFSAFGYCGFFDANGHLISQFLAEDGTVRKYPIGVKVTDKLCEFSIPTDTNVEYISVNLSYDHPNDAEPYAPGKAMFYKSSDRHFVDYQPYDPRLKKELIPEDVVTQDVLDNAILGASGELDTNVIRVHLSDTDLWIRQRLNDTQDICTQLSINENIRHLDVKFSKSVLIDSASEDDLNVYNNGTPIHQLSDSNAPILTSSYWYLGALHGLVMPQTWSSNHGKTQEDVGSLWLGDNGVQYYLVQILNNNQLVFFNKPIKDDSKVGTYLYDYSMSNVNTLNHIQSSHNAAHTTPINVGSVNQMQTHPCLKIKNLNIYVDNRKLEKNKFVTCKECRIDSCHTIIDPSSINTDIDSGHFMDYDYTTDMAELRFSYRFIYGNVSIYQSLHMLIDLAIEYYGYWQPMGLRNSESLEGSPTGLGVKVYTPNLILSPGGYTRDWGREVDCSYPVSAPQEVPSEIQHPEKWNYGDTHWFEDSQHCNKDGIDRHVQVLFERGSVHEDSDIPYFDIKKKILGFTTGFSKLYGAVKPSNHPSKDYGYLAAGNRRKMYWDLANPKSQDGVFHKGDIYDILFFFSYFNPDLNPECHGVYWYKDNDKYIIYIDMLKAVNNLFVKLPNFLSGKSISEITKTNNITINSDVITNGVYISTIDDNPAHIKLII